MARGWCYKDEPEVDPTEEETQSFICEMFSLVREIKKWRARERRQHNDIPITRTWKSQDVKARISLGGHNANCFPLFPE